ncbi:MAG: xanthine dehydrogenase accessory protein XdhC [Rubrivivax sp.]|nr:xanthine dehydrogenase accessory protein XdhC [Rubrivivax sp.]
MQDLRESGIAWRAQGRAAIVVTVGATRGSVPREAGTRMLVSADEVLGTIGGGHLELQAIAEARRMLSESPSAEAAGGTDVQTQRGPAAEALRVAPGTRTRHVALGPSLGQCCGGALDLHFAPLAALDPTELTLWPEVRPRFFLQLYGAGHVGRAIVRLLDELPCRVQWIDEREAEFPAASTERAHIERVCVEPVEAEVAAAPPNAYYLVLTHSHDLDLALAHAILRRGDFGFFGLIGSRTKRARFEHRLAERGVAPELIGRMTCPIGLPGIEGKEPEVLAVAAVAQLLRCASGLRKSSDRDCAGDSCATPER